MAQVDDKLPSMGATRRQAGARSKTTAPAEVAASWVPIRSLGRRHASRMIDHLRSLEARDRYLRFGYTASDEQIARYVESIDFTRDAVFGVFDRQLELVALSHLAVIISDTESAHQAEFGVSVAATARGQGLGSLLFDHAVLHARNRQVTILTIHALSENTAMLRIVRRAGADVLRDGSDAEARLQLPAENFATHLTALVQNQAAEMDFQLKRNARQFTQLLGLWLPRP